MCGGCDNNNNNNKKKKKRRKEEGKRGKKKSKDGYNNGDVFWSLLESTTKVFYFYSLQTIDEIDAKDAVHSETVTLRFRSKFAQ